MAWEPHGRAIVVSPLENEARGGIIVTELASGQRRGVFISMGDRSGIKAEAGDIIHYMDSDLPFLEEENLQFLHQNDVIAIKHKDGTLSSPDGTILVTSDGRFNDTVRHGSLELVVPVNEPNWTNAAKTKVTVAGTSGTTGCVKPGEEVFVNYGVLLNDKMACTIDGKTYWKAFCLGFASDVHAVERGGMVEALFGWALVEPGTTVAIESTLLVPESSAKSETTGTLRYIGENGLGLNAGMTVHFSEKDAFENDFNGEKLYTMRADRINGIIE